MTKPFDSTLKDLVEQYPADWAVLMGLPRPRSVDVMDADLATVMAEADKVLRIKDPKPWLLHLELQASHDPQLAGRILRYNVLLNGRHESAVLSAVVLLRPETDRGDVTGVLRQLRPSGECYLEFHYQVVRVWQEPAERFLEGGLGLLPLAPISAVSQDRLPAVIRRMADRLAGKVKPARAAMLWSASYILAGLRFPGNFTEKLFAGVHAMEESSTYQLILARGKSQEARRILLLLGEANFGPPGEDTVAAIEAISDVDRLEDLSRRLLHVESWQELLAPTPAPRRRNGKKRKSK